MTQDRHDKPFLEVNVSQKEISIDFRCNPAVPSSTIISGRPAEMMEIYKSLETQPESWLNFEGHTNLI